MRNFEPPRGRTGCSPASCSTEHPQACKGYGSSRFTLFGSVQVTVPAEPGRKELPRITASAEELAAKPVHLCTLSRLLPPATLLPAHLGPERYSQRTVWIDSRVFAWQVRELKQILDERKLSYAGLSEKRELVDRIRDTCQSVTYFAAS